MRTLWIIVIPSIIICIVIVLLRHLDIFPFTPKAKEQPYSEDLARWGDDMTYESLYRDNKDAKKAIKIAKQYGGYREYDAQYRLGNLYVIHGSTPPPSNVMDAGGSSETLGVILGDKPRFVRFPNPELFRHFMNLTRNDPTRITHKGHTQKSPEQQQQFALDTRTRVAILLATAESFAVQDQSAKYFFETTLKNAGIKGEPPTWKDENNELTIQFWVFDTSEPMAPEIKRYTVSVDSSQNYTSQCIDIDELARMEKDATNQPPF